MRASSERLSELRELARLERTTMLEQRGRAGEDPAESIAAIPSVDQLVVRELRDDLLESRGQQAEFLLARLAGRRATADAAAHRDNADRVEFSLLREIAEAYPELAVAVWESAGALSVSPGP